MKRIICATPLVLLFTAQASLIDSKTYPEGPCHFSLMSLSATRRLLLAALPLVALWLAVAWAAGWGV